MSVFLSTYPIGKKVGLSNYLKSVFSCHRLNQIYNNGFVPCVYGWNNDNFKTLFDCDKLVYGEQLEYKLYSLDNFDKVRGLVGAKPHILSFTWRFYLTNEDGVNCKPFGKEWYYWDDPNTIDFKYTSIPPHMIDLYLDIIKSFPIKKKLIDWVDYLSHKIGEVRLGVHVRTWKGEDSFYNNRYNHYLSTKQEIIDSISQSEHNKVLICSDDLAEVLDLVKYVSGKEFFFYIKREDFTELENDFCELLLLSRSMDLIGSLNSTFSELAWWYGGCQDGVIII